LELLDSLRRRSGTSYRVNTLKTDNRPLFDSERIPWCPCGYVCSEDVGRSIEHFMGLVYVQDAASMLSPQVFSLQPGQYVLDLCAAPGGKTSHLAQLMGNKGVLVANEVDGRRAKALRFNLDRMGVLNAVVSLNDGSKLDAKMRFDRILLDAPCSNSGQLLDDNAMNNWSPAKVKKMSRLQMALVKNCERLLIPGGELVYSTCSLCPEEDEKVINYAVTRCGFQTLEIDKDIRHHPPLMGWDGVDFADDVRRCLRIYPHDNDTTGFFVAKLTK